MIKDTTTAKHAAIRAEYDRLVREEYKDNPQRAKYIAKGYYIEKIMADPRFDVKGKTHIEKIINRNYDGKRSK